MATIKTRFLKRVAEMLQEEPDLKEFLIPRDELLAVARTVSRLVKQGTWLGSFPRENRRVLKMDLESIRNRNYQRRYQEKRRAAAEREAKLKQDLDSIRNREYVRKFREKERKEKQAERAKLKRRRPKKGWTPTRKYTKKVKEPVVDGSAEACIAFNLVE